MAELIATCEAPKTQGRIYVMNILTGKPSLNIDREGDIDDQDVFRTIAASEIPGTAQRVFGAMECKDGNCTHNVDIRVGKKATVVGLANVADVESISWNDPEE